MSLEVIPQPRVDTLVTDAGSGEGRRRTEYTGTAWIDGRAESAGLTLKRIGQPGMILPGKDVTFFVPDCLPYAREGLERAQLTVNMAMQASGDTGAILGAEAAFVDDPSGSPTWIQLHVSAHSGWPFAVSYRVVALVPPEAVSA